MTPTSPIRVWVRTLGNSCRIRLESQDHAQWLLAQLRERNALIGSDDVQIHPTDSGCRIQIPNAAERTLTTLETALREIPDVELMLSPEST